MAALDKGIARRVKQSSASPKPARATSSACKVSTRPSSACASATTASASTMTARPSPFFASATAAKPTAEPVHQRAPGQGFPFHTSSPSPPSACPRFSAPLVHSPLCSTTRLCSAVLATPQDVFSSPIATRTSEDVFRLAATRSRWSVPTFFSRRRRLPGSFGYTTLPDGNLLGARGLRRFRRFAHFAQVIRLGNLLILQTAFSRRFPRTC
jgi:hypothetical protein